MQVRKSRSDDFLGADIYARDNSSPIGSNMRMQRLKPDYQVGGLSYEETN